MRPCKPSVSRFQASRSQLNKFLQLYSRIQNNFFQNMLTLGPKKIPFYCKWNPTLVSKQQLGNSKTDSINKSGVPIEFPFPHHGFIAISFPQHSHHRNPKLGPCFLHLPVMSTSPWLQCPAPFAASQLPPSPAPGAAHGFHGFRALVVSFQKSVET